MYQEMKKIKNQSSQLSDINQITVDSLNDDCLNHIFDYLSEKEKLKLESVNHRWNRVLKTSWIRVTLKIENLLPPGFLAPNKINSKKTSNTNFLLNFLKNKGSFFLKLNLISLYLRCLNHETFLEKLPNYCNNLTHLTIRDIDKFFTDKNLSLLFCNNANLMSINLYDLSIYGDCFSNLSSNCIKELFIEACEIESEGYFYGFLSKLKFLHKLKFVPKFIFNVKENETMKVIEALIMSGCEDLSEISISGYEDKSNRSLSKFLSKQKKLRKLTVDHRLLINTELIENLPTEYLENFVGFLVKKNLSTYPFNSFYRFANLKYVMFFLKLFDDEFLISITKFMNTKNLNIYFYNYMVTEKLIRKLTINDQTPYKTQINHSKMFRNMETFSMTYDLYEDNEHVEPENCVHIDHALQYLSQCVNLKCLNIIKCNFKISGFKCDSFFPNLENLMVKHSLVDNLDIMFFVEKSINIKEINLHKNKNITEELIKMIYDLQNLRKNTKIIKMNICQDGYWDKFDKKKYKNLSPLILVNYY